MLSSLLRRVWMRLMVGPTLYAGDAAALDRLYRVSDPWRIGGEAEAARHAWTNVVLAREFGRPRTLLEVGAGEGHQTLRLLEAADAVTALELSPRAAARTRRRCPAAEVVVGGLDAAELDGRRFDVAVACEVLYYMPDPGAALGRLAALANGWLATWFDGERARLDAAVLGRPGVRSERFSAGGTSWTAAWRRL